MVLSLSDTNYFYVVDYYVIEINTLSVLVIQLIDRFFFRERIALFSLQKVISYDKSCTNNIESSIERGKT
jgi:hypothetical protein